MCWCADVFQSFSFQKEHSFAFSGILLITQKWTLTLAAHLTRVSALLLFLFCIFPQQENILWFSCWPNFVFSLQWRLFCHFNFSQSKAGSSLSILFTFYRVYCFEMSFHRWSSAHPSFPIIIETLIKFSSLFLFSSSKFTLLVPHFKTLTYILLCKSLNWRKRKRPWKIVSRKYTSFFPLFHPK